MKIVSNDDTAVISDNPKLVDHQNKWRDEIGEVELSDEEFSQVIDYAKYLISKRKR